LPHLFALQLFPAQAFETRRAFRPVIFYKFFCILPVDYALFADLCHEMYPAFLIIVSFKKIKGYEAACICDSKPS
jgi:hypothetical protein